MSSISFSQRKLYRLPKRYSKRRRFIASMAVNWPGMIRSRTNGMFPFLNVGLISKRDSPHSNKSN
ncbi:MAG: hypothetical protein ACI9GZ_002085 [Bacteroidia bacterium]|jgi:hypothetical protein